jgi:signal transduction histidine kinase
VPASKSNDSKTVHILIVDDNEDHCFLIQMALGQNPDWRVDCCHCVEEALRAVLRKRYDILLTDYLLPDGKGVELIDKAHNELAVVIMATQGSEKIAVDAIRRGAVDFVVKDSRFPIPLVEVIESIRSGENRPHRMATEIAESEPSESRQLEQDNRKLKELDRRKSEFLSTASHELRTPLTIIREFIAIVHDGVSGPVNDEQKSCLNSALSNCTRLEKLINDILDLQKLESGRFRFRRRRVNIGPALKECFNDFKLRLATQQQRLTLYMPDSLPYLLCDEGKIIQIVVNLLGNAHKYTPEGGAVALLVNPRGKHLVIAVKDNGAGIAPDDQSKVFEKFIQLGREHGPGARGTGLGLAIARNIVEMHDGEIWVRSTPGTGSTFFFTVPIYNEILAAQAVIKDRISFAENTGEATYLTLIQFCRGAGHTPGISNLGSTLSAGQNRLIEQLAQRFEEDVFVVESEDLIGVLTTGVLEEIETAIDQIATDISTNLPVDTRMNWGTMTLPLNMDSRACLAHAKAQLFQMEGDTDITCREA